jgi:hypothetical protein
VGPIITRRHQETRLTLSDAYRNVLVSQAQESNGIATRLLSWQQQIGLLRYHGVLGYWRQRYGLLQSTTSAAANHGTSDAPLVTPESTRTGNNANVNVAKVAFMITASMRKELSERLKYTAEDIKAMTPLEASLILHHSVKPTEK